MADFGKKKQFRRLSRFLELDHARRDGRAELACGKIRHATRARARKHLVDLYRRGRDGQAGVLEVYWCPLCQAFHVGHNRRKGLQHG